MCRAEILLTLHTYTVFRSALFYAARANRPLDDPGYAMSPIAKCHLSRLHKAASLSNSIPSKSPPTILLILLAVLLFLTRPSFSHLPIRRPRRRADIVAPSHRHKSRKLEHVNNAVQHDAASCSSSSSRHYPCSRPLPGSGSVPVPDPVTLVGGTWSRCGLRYCPFRYLVLAAYAKDASLYLPFGRITPAFRTRRRNNRHTYPWNTGSDRPAGWPLWL